MREVAPSKWMQWAEYQPTREDSEDAGVVEYQSICVLDDFKKWSFEELRLAD